jgi:AcrR family transcriptional regulator
MSETILRSVEAGSWRVRARRCCPLANTADIAKGAGVSRTALYHYFPGKDIFKALVEALHARTHTAAIEALEPSQSLDTALRGLLEAKFARALALISESPNGVELANLHNARRACVPRLNIVGDHAGNFGGSDDNRQLPCATGQVSSRALADRFKTSLSFRSPQSGRITPANIDLIN